MKLSYRLSLLISLLILIVLTVTLLISAHTSRNYLNRQLSSHAQDTATSLGLALSTALAEGDMASVISMTNAIFDRGDYTKIRIIDSQGATSFERRNPVKIDGVPDWFVHMLPLDAPMMNAKVMDGWIQAGEVSVQSHPGHAYRQLWENSRESTFWISLCGLLSLALGLMALHRLLQPLAQVEAQANAICRREFPTLSPLPTTPEFARIVKAMNRMTDKIREIIHNLEKLAEKLQAQAYRHPVTGLANKRHLNDALSDLLRGKHKSARGALFLLQIHDFKRYNELHGYSSGDQLLKAVGRHMSQISQTYPGCVVSHLSGGDFALLVEDMEPQDCGKLARQITETLTDLRYFEAIDSSTIAHLGVVAFDGQRKLEEILAQADEALRAAKAAGPNASFIAILNDKAPQSASGAAEQRRTIRAAIEARRISYQLQPVVGCPNKQPIHFEALARLDISEQGVQTQILTAGRVVPMAAAMGLCADVDRAMLRQALAWLNNPKHSNQHLAINIAPTSIEQPSFLPWLLKQLDHNPLAAQRLSLEMPEFALGGRTSIIHDLIEQLHKRHTRFGLDRYGRTEQSITHLKAFKLDHIKIDGAYSHSLEQQEEHQFFIQALTNIAHGLDIDVYVEAVESEQVWELLPTLSVDGAQGYFLGRPS
jgi:diguanylate cyclase (GGDEF)-like protein